ncbi:hypothetical protein PUV54_05705 [Hyphococcus flavus]|uniref:Uncharacterized protein n=1 Tax=Hyphococcus flavus TaxID=1866326 RepID=A0AAE9ZK84_9PROT|nr:hypothetical protein [Hyphococcus flavus]WDI32691.1 hypothetical protein PUV54_05705 [Hyphococcus flavus]
MIGRLLLIAAMAIGGAAAYGRRAVDREIEKRLPAEIEIARTRAIAELDKHINEVISERLVSFGLSLGVKAGLVAAIYLLFAEGHLTHQGLLIVTSALIAVFVLRDALRTLPYMAPAWRHIRKHRWNPRKALVEFVAGIAFERAYAEAMLAMETGPARYWLAFSKYNAHSISSEVGEAVADVARQTSFSRMKWRAIIAALLAAAMFAVYVTFFLLTVGAA